MCSHSHPPPITHCTHTPTTHQHTALSPYHTLHSHSHHPSINALIHSPTTHHTQCKLSPTTHHTKHSYPHLPPSHNALTLAPPITQCTHTCTTHHTMHWNAHPHPSHTMHSYPHSPPSHNVLTLSPPSHNAFTHTHPPPIAQCTHTLTTHHTMHSHSPPITQCTHTHPSHTHYTDTQICPVAGREDE